MKVRGSASPAFLRLDRAITACELCPRLRAYCAMVARTKKAQFRDWDYWGKPVPGFGDPEARLLVVGLAPAAHGGNRTGRVFTGDSSGDWLYEALHRYGFANQPASVSRDDGLALANCWVSAAARCAPPANRPAPDELDRCQRWLERELELLENLEVVVTLGHVAHARWLKASGWWARLAPRDRPAFAHGSVTVLADGITLISSYHPSRQNTNTGKLTRAMWHGVFARARRCLDASPRARRPASRVAPRSRSR